MPGNLLTIASMIQCPHGGMVMLSSSNSQTMADGEPVLLLGDMHPIIACPFTIGPRYSPCTRVIWLSGSARASTNGTPVLVESSIGLCLSAEGFPQGVATISSTQSKAYAS